MVRPPFTFERNTLGSNGSFSWRFIAGPPWGEAYLRARRSCHRAATGCRPRNPYVEDQSRGSASRLATAPARLPATGFILGSKDTILPEDPVITPCRFGDCAPSAGVRRSCTLPIRVGHVHCQFGGA